MALSRNAPALVALVAMSACGEAGSDVSSFEDGGEVTGSVSGEELTPLTWMAGTSSSYSFNGNGWPSEHTVVKIGDTERACGQGEFLKPPAGPANNLLLDLFDDPTQPDSRVAEPGTFEVSRIMDSISSSRRAIATFTHRAADGAGFLKTAQSGTVTVLTASADGISGTFDLGFSNGDQLTGTFGASLCEAPFPPLRIQTPGNLPEVQRIEITIEFAGCSPSEVVIEARSETAISTSELLEIEDGIWQLDSFMPTNNSYEATVTAKDDEGQPLIELSLAFEVNAESPTKIDTAVTCTGGPQ